MYLETACNLAQDVANRTGRRQVVYRHPSSESDPRTIGRSDYGTRLDSGDGYPSEWTFVGFVTPDLLA